MTKNYKHNWAVLAHDLKRQKRKWENKTVIADFLEIPRKTVSDAFRRGDLPETLLRDPYNENTPKVTIPEISIKRPHPSKSKKALFITDPHFGFNGEKSIHDGYFLWQLAQYAKANDVHTVMWGGDMFDFADFSKYRKLPKHSGNVQKAIIALNYFIGYFAQIVTEQKILSGNHDARLANFIVDYARPLHGLRRADGEQILTLKGLLSKEVSQSVRWEEKYPSDLFIGDVRFIHGELVRSQGGQTAYEVGRNASYHTFFGHIHRFELINKRIPDRHKNIWIGCPGHALKPRNTPGYQPSQNWSQGAFVLDFDRGWFLKDFGHLDSAKLESYGKYEDYLTFQKDLNSLLIKSGVFDED